MGYIWESVLRFLRTIVRYIYKSAFDLLQLQLSVLPDCLDSLWLLVAVSNNHPTLVFTMVTDAVGAAGSPKARNDGWLQKEIRVCGGWGGLKPVLRVGIRNGSKSPAGHLRRLLRFITVVLNFNFSNALICDVEA